MEADRHGWQIVRVLYESELGTSVEGLTLEAEAKGLTVKDLELDAEVMLADFLRVIEYVEIHLLARGQ